MPIHVLVASTSAYRRSRYVDELSSRGMQVTVAMDGIDCIARMRSARPDVLLLELSLLWGASHGVLAVRSEEPDLQTIPVVLMAVDGMTDEWYSAAQYSIQGFLLHRTSGELLASTLKAVATESFSANERPPMQNTRERSSFTRVQNSNS